ncbi:hypothetical protein LO772_30410 [Yinghuangia sp. ASG 101]|uniref:hypothetical protein n=1 Tax=Yinghuangia sp. ASG 101 TaxID=2896848 RepID=UPI001E365B60|nr:hypothetical protein [Yinghuangia sp. ASG 101]UGQ11075.1 hypothetical protein LO772_30410 [Yinghuangia sp. ASG 101]
MGEILVQVAVEHAADHQHVEHRCSRSDQVVDVVRGGEQVEHRGVDSTLDCAEEFELTVVSVE